MCAYAPVPLHNRFDSLQSHESDMDSECDQNSNGLNLMNHNADLAGNDKKSGQVVNSNLDSSSNTKIIIVKISVKPKMGLPLAVFPYALLYTGSPT